MTEQPAKPTPVGWFVRDCPQAPGDIEVVLGDDFKIYIPLMATDWDDAKRSRMRNRAKLIAAAPDMLEALENIENDDQHMPSTAWDLIQAAIAKARGQS